MIDATRDGVLYFFWYQRTTVPAFRVLAEPLERVCRHAAACEVDPLDVNQSIGAVRT